MEGASDIKGHFLKSVAWNTVGIATYFTCQWLITIITVWLFDDFIGIGLLALAMNITNFFVCIAGYNMRVFHVSDIEGEYTAGDYITSRVLTCVLSFFLCLAYVLVVGLSLYHLTVIMVYMLFRINEAFIDVYHGINQQKWKMNVIGTSLVLRGVLSLASFVIFGWIGGILWAVFSMFIVTLVIGILYDHSRTNKFVTFSMNINKNVIQLLKVCFPLMLVLLIATFISSFARVSIDRIHGTDALGVFSAVIAPTMVIQVAVMFIFAPLTNVFSKYFADRDTRKFAFFFLYNIMIIAFIIVVAFLASLQFGEWALFVLYGDTILPFAYLLPTAVAVAGLTAFMGFMSLVLTVVRDIRGLLFGNIVGGLLCLALADMFLHEFGLIGANYVILVSQGVAVLYFCIRLLLFLNSRRVKCQP